MNKCEIKSDKVIQRTWRLEVGKMLITKKQNGEDTWGKKGKGDKENGIR